MDAQDNTMMHQEHEALRRRSQIVVASNMPQSRLPQSSSGLPPNYSQLKLDTSASSSEVKYEIPGIEEGSEMHLLLEKALQEHVNGGTHKLR